MKIRTVTTMKVVSSKIVHPTPYGEHWHPVPKRLPCNLAYRLYARVLSNCPENQVSREEYYGREPHEMAYAVASELDWNNHHDHKRAVIAVERGWRAPDEASYEYAVNALAGGPL